MNAKHLIPSLFFGGVMTVISFQAKAVDDKQKSLCFVENKGQVTDQFHHSRRDIDFRFQADGLNLFVGNGALHYQWVSPETDGLCKSYRMDVTLIDANLNAQVLTQQVQNYSEHYYTSTSGRDGVTAHSFRKITYQSVYPEIDWILYVKDNSVEYDFFVHPGGNVSDIKLKYDGATELFIDQNGELNTKSPFGSVKEAAPVSFQQDGKIIASSFVLEGNILSFQITPYEGSLTIDPTISWATYYGGTNNETIRAGCITADNYGNSYYCGYTPSTTNIATTGSHQATLSGGSDAFIVKFNEAGVRQWASYYGGTGSDFGMAVTCDPNGNPYLCGHTSSTGMSSTGSHQATGGGSQDAYLVKFDTSGVRQWATYYGGTGSEQGLGVACDLAGNVYLCGSTTSSASIATTGSFKTTNSGSTDAYLVKFNSGGIRQWGTYYGGTSFDLGQSMTCDDSNNVVLTGYTMSSTGIATTGAYQTTFGGSEDVYLSKFDSAGVRLWATYYGGAGIEEPSSVKCDGSSSVYVCGSTTSTSGIATTGSYQETYGGGAQDACLAKFGKEGSRIWGTYYGGAGNEAGNSIATSALGNIYFTGSTTSTTAIATIGTFQDTLNGTQDVFLAKFDTSGVRNWATYYGGELAEIGYGVFCNAYSKVFVAGSTKSYTGLATTGAHQTAYAGGTFDGFVAKFDDCVLAAPSSIAGQDTVCRNATYTYYVPAVAGAISYSWMLPSGWTGTSTTDSILVTTGTTDDTIRLVVNFLCGSSTVITKPITVAPLPSISPTGTHNICFGDSLTLVANTGSTYQWLQGSMPVSGASNQTFYAKAAGTYAVIVTNTFGCADTSFSDTLIVHPLPLPLITLSGLVLNTGVYSSYQWNHNGIPITGATSSTYTISVLSGNYTVNVTDSNGCQGTSASFDASVLGVSDISLSKSKVNIYPNPSFDLVFINSELPVNITLYSMDGKQLLTANNVKSIDVSFLASGIYTLRITDNEGIMLQVEKLSVSTEK